MFLESCFSKVFEPGRRLQTAYLVTKAQGDSLGTLNVKTNDISGDKIALAPTAEAKISRRAEELVGERKN